MKYHLISDSQSISEDIKHFKEHADSFLNQDGTLVIDLKVRLTIEEGMDSILCEVLG